MLDIKHFIFRNIHSWTMGTQHQPPHYTPLASMAIKYMTTNVPMDWEPSFTTTEPLAGTDRVWSSFWGSFANGYIIINNGSGAMQRQQTYGLAALVTH